VGLDLELCLEVVQSHVNHCVTFAISETVREREAWFQMINNRKWPIGSQMVRWAMTSCDPEAQYLEYTWTSPGVFEILDFGVTW